MICLSLCVAAFVPSLRLVSHSQPARVSLRVQSAVLQGDIPGERGPSSAAVPRPLLYANAATKWVVVAAQTTAVLTRQDFVSPYIVIGSIAAAFGTAALKRIINQQRPAGAPFTDPGMPSSHALVATFAATAWAIQLQDPIIRSLLVAVAATISILRVATGYHTWPQVGVGSLLGAGGAWAWMVLNPTAGVAAPGPLAMGTVYASYVLGSALFVLRKMRSWSAKR